MENGCINLKELTRGHKSSKRIVQHDSKERLACHVTNGDRSSHLFHFLTFIAKENFNNGNGYG